MDAARSRGRPRGRGRGRGSSCGGKAVRARGAQTRGMRVPPEYLQRVIAERQGLDPDARLPDDDEQEEHEREDVEDAEDGAERESRYRRRELGTNADRYEELEGGDAGEDDEERAKETARILEKMRLRALSTAHPQHPPGAGPSTPGVQTSSGNGTGRPLGDGGDDDDDVDHALGARLNALRGNRTHAGGRGKGHVVTIEWDERMEVMRRDKAETEARAALKARFRGQAPAPRGLKSNNVAPVAGTAGDPGVGNSGDSAKKLDELEDFLDDLLG